MTWRRPSRDWRAALYGDYDATEFDRAVMAYREADSTLLRVRRALDQRRANSASSPVAAPSAAPVPAPPAVAIAPTPRLLFARWLVRTGRLSEWEPAETAA